MFLGSVALIFEQLASMLDGNWCCILREIWVGSMGYTCHEFDIGVAISYGKELMIRLAKTTSLITKCFLIRLYQLDGVSFYFLFTLFLLSSKRLTWRGGCGEP